MDSKMMLLAGLYFGILAVQGQLIGSNSRLSGVLPPRTPTSIFHAPVLCFKQLAWGAADVLLRTGS